MRLYRDYILIFLLLVISGCSSVATRNKFYIPIAADISDQNYYSAIEKLEKAKEENKFSVKDRLIYYLDSGFANHYASMYDSSNVKLTYAENLAEELFTKSISRAAASMLLNDNTLEYAGEDYEVLYTNLFKSLNYFKLNKFDDALVEIRRVNLKLELLEQKYADAANTLKQGSPDDTSFVEMDYNVQTVRFNNDAFARYLSMHMYAADGKYDDARIDYDYLVDAFDSQPHIYNFAMPDVSYYSEDKAILSVVGLTGLAPVKEPFNLRIRTDKDLDLVQILYKDGENNDAEYGHLIMPVSADYYFKFAIPKLLTRPSAVSEIRVYLDHSPKGKLQLLEDINTVALETFEAKKSLIYFRSIARAVAKGLSNHKAKKKVDTGGVEGWLKKAAIDVATDLTENADLRSSQFLPGQVYVNDFEVDPGLYDITIEFVGFDGETLFLQNVEQFKVNRGDFNLIEAVYLD
jgi:hypothetical protein